MTTKTLGQVEARAEAAERELTATKKRLDDLDREHAAYRASMPARVRAQTQELRRAVDKVNTALRAQQAEAARLAGELEAAQAEVAALKAELQPPRQEEAVLVRWTRDGTASVNDRVYTGREGDVHRVPAGVGEVLGRQGAGYVEVLGRTGTQPQDYWDRTAGLIRPQTAAELRAAAAELVLVAGGMEREQAALARAGGEG